VKPGRERTGDTSPSAEKGLGLPSGDAHGHNQYGREKHSGLGPPARAKGLLSGGGGDKNWSQAHRRRSGEEGRQREVLVAGIRHTEVLYTRQTWLPLLS